jgi:hypothetical protein
MGKQWENNRTEQGSDMDIFGENRVEQWGNNGKQWENNGTEYGSAVISIQHGQALGKQWEKNETEQGSDMNTFGENRVEQWENNGKTMGKQWDST